jgi:hypothetical protein
MVRRGNHDSVDSFLILQHDSEIAVLFSFWVTLERICRPCPVHIAQRNDILAIDIVQVPSALAAHTDAGYVKLLARGRSTLTAQNVCRHNCHCRNRGGTTHENTPGDCGITFAFSSFLFFHINIPHKNPGYNTVISSPFPAGFITLAL